MSNNFEAAHKAVIFKEGYDAKLYNKAYVSSNKAHHSMTYKKNKHNKAKAPHKAHINNIY